MCYYRDKNSINKFQVAKVTTEGIDICEPFALETNWDFKVHSTYAQAHGHGIDLFKITYHGLFVLMHADYKYCESIMSTNTSS